MATSPFNLGFSILKRGTSIRGRFGLVDPVQVGNAVIGAVNLIQKHVIGSCKGFQGYLESGFTREGAYDSVERQRAWLEAVASSAKEAGYDFSALNYLKDCICKQGEDDPGPDLDNRYWPEDDPNVWNYGPYRGHAS